MENELIKDPQASLHFESKGLISARTIVPLFLLLFLFLAFVLVTPVEKQAPELIKVGTPLLLVLIALRLVFFTKMDNFNPRKIQVSIFLLHLNALAIGLLPAYALMKLQLGWTTLFTILLSLSLGTIHLSLMIPSFLHLAIFQFLLMSPAILANFIFVHGLQGLALGLFYLGISILHLLVGKLLANHYWVGRKANARLEAIFEALPGTLACINKDRQYLLVNQKQADLWHKEKSDFIGKFVGVTQTNGQFSNYIDEVFNRPDQAPGRLFERNGKLFYMVGQKYNYGTEMVVLGMDVTETEELKQRFHGQENLLLQTQYKAHLANLSHFFYPLLENKINSSQSEGLQKQVFALLHNLFENKKGRNQDRVEFNSLLNDLQQLLAPLGNYYHFTINSKVLPGHNFSPLTGDKKIFQMALFEISILLLQSCRSQIGPHDHIALEIHLEKKFNNQILEWVLDKPFTGLKNTIISALNSSNHGNDGDKQEWYPLFRSLKVFFEMQDGTLEVQTSRETLTLSLTVPEN